MVLRPIYLPQGDEQNMQYPYRSTDPSDQAPWQTPYGGECQTTVYNDDSVPAQGSSTRYDQIQLAPAGAYAAPNGENSTYYDNAQQQSPYSSSWSGQKQPSYGQEQYNDAPAYATASNEAPQGPYGYEHPSARPLGTQGSYNPEAHHPTPEVKQEEQTNVHQYPPHRDTFYSASPDVRSEQGYQSIPGQVSPPSSNQAFEQDRGLMGAIAGAAAGHKMHHGFLGTLGGAYAGHKLEDAYKNHKEHSQAQSAAPPPGYTQQAPVTNLSTRQGNFSASSHDITLDKDYDLIASCKDVKGRRKLSAISLNNVLTNDDGWFRWVNPSSGRGNFAASARHVKLKDSGRTLEAELRCMNGQWRKDVVCLDERIENADGDLKMT